MNATTLNLDDWLKPLIRAVLQEVMKECGESAAPKLYDIDAAAGILSLPKRWLYERTANNSIPHRKIGKYVRFTDADLRQIVEKPSGGEPDAH